MDRCDIIIPVWNQLEATRDCIDSIIKNTSYPFRLIIIDNASDDATRRYLESLKQGSSLQADIIRNDKNLGFVKAVNQGMAASDANYICILNNDTLVTRLWLTEMINVAESHKDIGIVNPSSNNLGQKPAQDETIESYAESIRRQSGRFSELGSAIGFCMLIKRVVLDKIGLFDEIYGMGNFEDTDFSRKAAKAGFICVRACGAYVYHRENTSFDKIRAFDDDFKRNKEIYEFRWGKPKRVAYVLNPADAGLSKRLGLEAMKLARQGNWVKYYCDVECCIPGHSNISSEILGKKNLYLNVLAKVLVKKKKFDEIVVGNDKFGRILEKLHFIHKAKVRYY